MNENNNKISEKNTECDKCQKIAKCFKYFDYKYQNHFICDLCKTDRYFIIKELATTDFKKDNCYICSHNAMLHDYHMYIRFEYNGCADCVPQRTIKDVYPSNFNLVDKDNSYNWHSPWRQKKNYLIPEEYQRDNLPNKEGLTQRDIFVLERSNFYYSPMTDTYYPTNFGLIPNENFEYEKKQGPGKSTLIDTLIGTNGIIAGRCTEARFGDTRMMSYQSGRINSY